MVDQIQEPRGQMARWIEIISKYDTEGYWNPCIWLGEIIFVIELWQLLLMTNFMKWGPGHSMVDIIIPRISKKKHYMHRLAYMTTILGSWNFCLSLTHHTFMVGRNASDYSHLMLERREEKKYQQICHGLGYCSNPKHKPEFIFCHAMT